MRRLALTTIALVFLLACGDSSDGGAGGDLGDCENQVSDLVEALSEIDSRLSVGLNYDEYGDYVGDARVVYDRLDIDAMTRQCVTRVGVKLEDSLNEYVTGLQEWGDCIDSAVCNPDTDDDIQKAWADGGELLNDAKAVLTEES